jgi:hypothetical protein
MRHLPGWWIGGRLQARPKIDTYNSLFEFIDDESGEYMALHDDWYEEEEEEEGGAEEHSGSKQRPADDREIHCTLQALRKMPKMRSKFDGDAMRLNASRHGGGGKGGAVADKTARELDDAIASNNTMSYLLQNCMISDTKLRRYQIVFEKCSIEKPGICLNNEELIAALRRVNCKLIGAAEIKYIFYILDLLGSSSPDVHDFQAFSAIAALSERVAPMEQPVNPPTQSYH